MAEVTLHKGKYVYLGLRQTVGFICRLYSSGLTWGKWLSLLASVSKVTQINGRTPAQTQGVFAEPSLQASPALSQGCLRTE